MTLRINTDRIFVAGATGFLGASVVYALLQTGAEVTALVPEGADFRLGQRSPRVHIVRGDAWNPGSLVGRSRGHGALIHLVGSLKSDPQRGLTYDYLNVVSLRNVIRMAARDGVPHVVYLSAAWSPWMPGAYVRSKRQAEAYLMRSGLAWTLVRAPLVYPRGQLHNPLMVMIGMLGLVPLLGIPFARWAPLPVDVAGKALAFLALNSLLRGDVLYSGRLRRLAAQYDQALAGPLPGDPRKSRFQQEDGPPFGWLP